MVRERRGVVTKREGGGEFFFKLATEIKRKEKGIRL
jgi:hypothetical protein